MYLTFLFLEEIFFKKAVLYFALIRINLFVEFISIFKNNCGISKIISILVVHIYIFRLNTPYSKNDRSKDVNKCINILS